MEQQLAQQQDDDAAAAARPFYYFVAVFGAIHFLVASALFVRQRSKFPLSGHNPSLTLPMAVRFIFSCFFSL